MTDYEWLNTIINAITGLGTVSAVVTSLYLARSQIRPKIDIELSFCVIAGSNRFVTSSQISDGNYKFINFSVTNVGMMKESIELYGYSFGVLKWKKRVYVVPSNAVISCKTFPSVIDPGEKIHDFVPLQIFKEIQVPFFFRCIDEMPIPRMLKMNRIVLRIAMLSARCWVSVSRSNALSKRLGSGITRFVINGYLERRN